MDSENRRHRAMMPCDAHIGIPGCNGYALCRDDGDTEVAPHTVYGPRRGAHKSWNSGWKRFNFLGSKVVLPLKLLQYSKPPDLGEVMILLLNGEHNFSIMIVWLPHKRVSSTCLFCSFLMLFRGEIQPLIQP